MTFSVSVQQIDVKNQAVSFLKTKWVLNKLGLDAKKHMRDCIFSTEDGVVIFNPTKGTKWKTS